MKLSSVKTVNPTTIPACRAVHATKFKLTLDCSQSPFSGKVAEIERSPSLTAVGFKMYRGGVVEIIIFTLDSFKLAACRARSRRSYGKNS